MASHLSGTWVRAASLADVSEGDVLGVTIGETEIALYKLGGRIYATSNICTHALGRLSDGSVYGEAIECPLHAGRFDIKTGRGLCDPITEDIQTYRVRVHGDEVHVEV